MLGQEYVIKHKQTRQTPSKGDSYVLRWACLEDRIVDIFKENAIELLLN